MEEKIVLGLMHVYDQIIDGTLSEEHSNGISVMLTGAILAMGVHVMGHSNPEYRSLLDTLTIRANKADSDPSGTHWTTPVHLRPKDTAIFEALISVKHYKKHVTRINNESYFNLRALNPKMRNDLVWDGFKDSNKTDLMKIIKQHNLTLYLGADHNFHIFDSEKHLPNDKYELTKGISLVVHHG